MMRTSLALATLLLLPGPAFAQDRLRSGPDAPALSAQPPPASPPREAGAEGGVPRPRHAPDDPPRTAPPEGHRTLGAPSLPGAERPDASEGFFTDRDPIPPNIGERIRPGGTTTGR